MERRGNKMKKYIVIDLLTGMVLCVLAGFFALILNKQMIPRERLEQWLELFVTVTGSLYVTAILSRIKTKDFSKKKTKEEVKRIILFSCVLMSTRFAGTMLYPILQKHGEMPAIMITGLIDIMGIVIVFRLLPHKEKPEAEKKQDKK